MNGRVRDGEMGADDVRSALSAGRVAPQLAGVAKQVEARLGDVVSERRLEPLQRDYLIELFRKRGSHLQRRDIEHGGLFESVASLESGAPPGCMVCLLTDRYFFQCLFDAPGRELVGLVFVSQTWKKNVRLMAADVGAKVGTGAEGDKDITDL